MFNFSVDPGDIISFIIGAIIMACSAYGAIERKFSKITLKFTNHISILETKLEDLEEKMDKHNQLIERTYKNEADIKEIKGRINAKK